MSTPATTVTPHGRPSERPLEERSASRRATRMRARLLSALKDAAALVAFGAVLVGVWQAIYALNLISHFALPSATDTAAELWSLTKIFFQGGYVFDATMYTLQEVIFGFLIALATGVALGVVVGETRFGQRVLMPYLVGVNVMPRIAFAPVFVAWLGFGMLPKIFLAAFIAFFPVVINIALGMRSCSTDSLLLFQSMEASRWQTMRKLKLPTALPNMFAGLKTAMVLSVIGAIVGEFLGGSAKGDGQLINVAAQQLAIDQVFSLIIILSVMGMLLYGALMIIERRVVYWRTAEQRQQAALT
jgi:NitT/TauT family transport system permease protein